MTGKVLLTKLLKRYGACEEAVAWCAAFDSPSGAWLACRNPEHMLWALDTLGVRDDRAYRLFACWCVRNTPLPDGRKVWDLLTDERSRMAVEVAERFADGKATEEERDAALAAAWDAAGAAAGDAQADALREFFGNPFADAEALAKLVRSVKAG